MRFSATRHGDRMLLALLAGLGFAEAIAVYWWNPFPRSILFQLAYAIVTGAIILRLARSPRPLSAPSWAIPALLGGLFCFTIIVAQFALEAFPNSGDEHGYLYVADTLLHGRLWNQAYPPDLRDVLETFYIGGHGDQRLSQYAPGWPAVLLPFERAGLPQFANAVIGALAALFMLQALRCLPIPRSIQLAALLLGVAAPFTVFNDASFFSHPLTAATLLAIVWLDLRDTIHPSAWNRAGIGVAFSLLLATRFEVCLVAAALFAVDGLCRHRHRFVRWFLPGAIAAAPLTILLLAYNSAITGSPFITTIAWVSPQIGLGLDAAGQDGPHSSLRGLLHTIIWFASWQDFAAVLLIPLYVVALWHRVAGRTLRWFDLLWPASVVLFFFFPDNGGFQYGPRYWYAGYAVMPLTLAAGLPRDGEFWRVWGCRLNPLRLATAQLASFGGFSLAFAAFLHIQTENRLTPFRLALTAPAPAMVLMSDVDRRYVSWQDLPYAMLAKDFTRNGVGPLGPTVIAIDRGDRRTALLCARRPERAIYRIHLNPVGPGGSLVPVCNGATSPP